MRMSQTPPHSIRLALRWLHSPFLRLPGVIREIDIWRAANLGRKALPDNAGLKHLQAWGERIGSRPGVQKGMKLEN